MNRSSFIQNKIIPDFEKLFFMCGLIFLFGDILGIYYSFSIVFIFIGCFLLFWVFLRKKVFWILFSLSILWGYFLWHTAIIGYEDNFNLLAKETSNFSQSVWVKWTINGVLYKKYFSNVYRLNLDKIDTFDTHSPQNRQKNLSIFLEIPSNLHISPGDHLSFTGKIAANIHFPLAGYDRYALINGWYGVSKIYMYQKDGDSEKTFIENIQSYWENTFRYYFPDDVAGTILGMTIGSIDLLSNDTKSDFIKSGISHILVVSWSNIAFLILIVSFFLKYIPVHRNIRILLILWILLFYGSLVGWWISVLRAIIMGSIGYITVEYGRKWWWNFALLLSCILLTLYSPLSLVYDAWFWLSFGATFGILVFHPYFESIGKKYHFPKWFISWISITLWASLGSLPAMVYHFWTIPLGGLLANILIGWILWCILFTSVFLIWIQFISSFWAYIFWYIVYIPTHYVLMVGNFFSNWPIINIPEWFQLPITSFLLGLYSVILLEKGVKKNIELK